MTNIVNLTFDNQSIELSELEDIGYRIQRLAFDTNKLSSSGGDFSTSFTLPKSKNNVKALKVTDEISSINKFNRLKAYDAILYINGQQVFRGVALLKRITKRGYEVEMKGENVEWIQLLDNIRLNRLGYIQDPNNPSATIPTWLVPFNGGETINQLNDLNNQQTDIFFPTIVYNNTPKTDYFDFGSQDIFGIYDGTKQTSPAKDFPNILNCQTGYFGPRQGLTFEDFPPAIYYSNLIKKCFAEIGWNVTGEIFNTDWFNRLYIPYTGTGFYKYNWKTLAYLFVNPTNRLIPLQPVLLMFSSQRLNYSLVQNNATWGNSLYSVIGFNIPYTDNLSTRIDNVANFKKFLVTDNESQVPESSRSGYICPADGRYKIRLKSKFKRLLDNTNTAELDGLDAIGSGNAGFGWDDNTCIITRQNQNGEFVLSEPSVFENVIKAMENRPNLWTTPSDIIAFVSPKRCQTLGANDVKSAGSPLSNFEEIVTVNSFNHSSNIISTTRVAESEVDFTVTIDLLKNERVHCYWVGLMQYEYQNFVGQEAVENCSAEVNYTSYSDNIFEIEYLCGQEDLDIADNLPEITAKELISNFIRMFNLKLTVNIGSKTVDFAFISSFYTDKRTAYDITNKVDLSDGINIESLDSPALLTIGYDNDEKDRLLFSNKALCVGEERIGSDYANINQFENDNVYANGELISKNGFSSTKFVTGYFQFVDTDLYSLYDTQPPFKVILTQGSLTFTQGINYKVPGNATSTFFFDLFSTTYDVPSIQSEESFNQLRLGDLEYDYDYKLRILMNLGSAHQFFANKDFNYNDFTNYKITDKHRIKINNPDYERIYVPFTTRFSDNFWIKPTVSAFDVENFYTGSNPSIESTTSLRYDNGNLKGLYDLYFDDVIDTYNKSHLLELDVALRPYDWTQMQSNRLIKYKNDVYKLVSIKDYDPINANLAKVTLMKLV